MNPWWVPLLVAVPTVFVAVFALLVTVRKEATSFAIEEVKLRGSIVREIGQAAGDLVEDSRRVMNRKVTAGATEDFHPGRQLFIGRWMVITTQLDAYLGMSEDNRVPSTWDQLQLQLRRYNLMANFESPKEKRAEFAASVAEYASPFYVAAGVSDWSELFCALEGEDFKRVYDDVGNVLLSRVGPLVKAIVSSPPSPVFRLQIPLRVFVRRSIPPR